tara:strand:+ start:70 stop:495 length:426 start_codon:yes stop_codon:yes gene_type:complete
MDKRKNNGGASTKSKKAFDRRKRISISNNDSFNQFFGRVKEDMMVFYESAYKGFLDKYVRHGEYYVYFHYLNDELVYIGKGTGERVNNWSSRNDYDHSMLIAEGSIVSVIISNNLTSENALMIESALIKQYNPKYNTHGRT